MVEKLSRHIALWLIKSGILENDDIDLYIYANIGVQGVQTR